ncbi:MAG: acyl-CoA desaturase [Gemmatimonadetes bacterium]|nr:acyl-CoA desaturase [Gemmatimonadota bacterium]
MYLKTAAIFAWFALSYVLLVFVARGWWQVTAAAASLALAMAAIGFNIQHDGAHGGYSASKLVGRVMAFALDVIGGSSYFWRWKHNVLHHTYPNIEGADDDINVGALGRLAPQQPRYRLHRFQHVYMWLLYGLITVKWQLVDDFKELIEGRVGTRDVPRPKDGELVLFVVGKVVFFSLAFLIPLLLHPWWAVLVVYAGTSFGLGILLGVVFQLAHCVEEADFPAPSSDTLRMAAEWAVHQVHTTVDFARHSRLLTLYLGGLNYQIEHHLFPHICHLHYPKLAPIVEDVCRRFGVRYQAHPSLRAALASHYRWLREMGRPAADPEPA